MFLPGCTIACQIQEKLGYVLCSGRFLLPEISRTSWSCTSSSTSTLCFQFLNICWKLVWPSYKFAFFSWSWYSYLLCFVALSVVQCRKPFGPVPARTTTARPIVLKGGQGCGMYFSLSGISGLSFDSPFLSLPVFLPSACVLSILSFFY